MSREKQIEIEKQIEEMACDICPITHLCIGEYKPTKSCYAFRCAEVGYENGYRKQSEGVWKLNKDGSGTCSECGMTQKNVWDYDSWQKFCGCCGAKMKGGDEETHQKHFTPEDVRKKEVRTMDKEKQLEEMAKILSRNCGDCQKCDHFNKEVNGIDSCYFKYAEMVYNADYRKQVWISVEERLPDEEGEYLVAYHPCYIDAVRYGEMCVGIDTFRDSGWERRKFQRVTHWMQKPELPKMDGDADETS